MKHLLFLALVSVSLVLTSCGSDGPEGKDPKDSTGTPSQKGADNNNSQPTITVAKTPENCSQLIKDFEKTVIEYISFANAYEKSQGGMDAASGNEIKAKGTEIEKKINEEGINKIGMDCWVVYSQLSIDWSKTGQRVLNVAKHAL